MLNVISRVLIASSIILAGCGSLPDKNKIEEGAGILVIAKAYTSEVSYEPGWAPEVLVTSVDANKADFSKVVRLHPIRGKQFQTIKDLAPGNYNLWKIRYVPTDHAVAIGSGSPWETLGISFKIFPEKATVLKKVLVAKTFNMPGGSQFRTAWNFTEWFPAADRDYKELMEKYNKKGTWEVVGDDEQPFFK